MGCQICGEEVELHEGDQIQSRHRLSGLISIDVMVDGQVVVDAKVKGNQYCGFEHMLVGRDIQMLLFYGTYLRICS